MELKRLERALADRWALVVGLGVLGVVAALIFGSIASNNQTSLFESNAGIRFVAEDGSTVADLAAQIAEAHDYATIAAEELLAAYPNSLIVEDLANSRLNFIAQGSTRLEAESRARDLRKSFLDVDPTLGGSVDQLLDDVQTEAEEIQSQIDEIQPPVTDELQNLEAQYALIDEHIAAINSALIALAVEETGADSERRAQINVQRDNLNDDLAELINEEAALPPLPEDRQLSAVETLRLSALQRRLEGLTAEYQRLYLRSLGVTAEGGGVEPISTQDLTPEPLDPIVNAAIGLLGGLLIAVLAIVFVTRTRRPVWLAEDITLPLLGDVPARRVTADTSANWYDTAESGERKTSIQALRSTIEAQVPGAGATIGITGLEVPAEGVQALAADLANSMASGGSSVLLVDANFESSSQLGQYKASGSSVAGILSLNPAAPEFEAEVRYAIERAHQVRSGLSVLPSGPPPASPADQLAGRPFRQLVAFARESHDVVVVVVDSVDRPSAQVAMQRLGYGVLVLTPGRSTIPQLNSAVGGVDRLRIKMLGAVFLEKDRRLFGRFKRQTVAPPREQMPTIGDQPVQSPIARLHKYPVLDDREAAPHRSLEGLAESIGSSGLEEGDDIGNQLLTAIRDASSDRAAESVADYIVSQTEDMVLARHGQADLSNQLIGAVSDYGFLTLRRLSRLRTVASWMDHEIAAEAGEAGSAQLLEAMADALGASSAETGIDDWLDENFMSRHLERTGGEPNVWHLRSPEGEVSILVPARRLSVQQLELIQAEVVERTVDELERRRSQGETSESGSFGDMDARIHDVRIFERSLSGLISSDANGRGSGAAWKPDWSKGTRANLAPLQAAEVLPFHVLSPEEMADLVAS